MVKSGATGSVSMHVQSEDFHRVWVESRSFDKNLRKELTKALRLAGAVVVADVKAEIGRIPSSGRYSRGARTALQRGTRVAISGGNRAGAGAGIRITTGAKGVPAGAFNKPSFRRPVFPNSAKTRTSWTWTNQQGRPFFGSVIEGHRAQMQQQVEQAVQTTANTLAQGVEQHG